MQSTHTAEAAWRFVIYPLAHNLEYVGVQEGWIRRDEGWIRRDEGWIRNAQRLIQSARRLIRSA